MNDTRHPVGGDAVRLTKDWCGAKAGAIGIIGGYPDEVHPEPSITFNASVFRGRSAFPYNSGESGVVVSCSGGPGTFATPIGQLRDTGQNIEVSCWRWNSHGPGAGNDERFTVSVALWEWDGPPVQLKDDATSIVGRIAGLTADEPPKPPVSPEQLVEAFCTGRDAAYSGNSGKTCRDDEAGYTVHKGFCGYNGRRDTDDSLLTGFDDGYEFMGFLEDRGWVSLPQKGEWPYLAYLQPSDPKVLALTEYCEGDLQLWLFDTAAARRAFYGSLPDA